MEESPIFYSIKDVAKQLGLPSHVLRFWETKFPEIKPVHRSGSCRYYRKEDVDLLIKIQDLLHNKGYTIKGAKAVLSNPSASEEIATVTKKEAAVAESPRANSVADTKEVPLNNTEIKEKLCVLRDFVKNILKEDKKS